MGQKINPNIFRLGVNKTWKTEFFEKKQKELPLYTFKDLEIKNYIERFLELHGILVHDYKQQYSNSTLYLYISYFVSSEFSFQKKDKNAQLVLINESEKEKSISPSKIRQSFSDLKIFSTKNSRKSLFTFTSAENLYRIRHYLKNNDLMDKPFFVELPTSTLVNLLEEDSYCLSNRNLNTKVETVLNYMFKVLSLFTNNKFNIIINFGCLNKNSTFLKSTQNKSFILLQKFKSTPFFHEGIELLFHVVYNKNTANLLAKFVVSQIRKIKRQKFFLAFLKQSLAILINSKLSKVKGVKITVKGRLNGVPRAKHKTIVIGDVPTQSLKEKLDYSGLSTHNSIGSYGIKVWIVEKI